MFGMVSEVSATLVATTHSRQPSGTGPNTCNIQENQNHSKAQAVHIQKVPNDWNLNTEIFLSFRTDRSGQTVQTQIRLLLEEQSDQGLHCLQFPLHLLDALLEGNAILFNF